jgi:hypothetical protein
MKKLFALSLIVATIASCGDKAEKEQEKTPDSTNAAIPDTTEYLPVASLLSEDIRNVETYGAGILRKASSGHTKDSMYIQYRDFQILAGQFLVKELDSAYFKDHFTETSLMDETSKMLNFIYTATDTTSPLRKVIVYIQPTMATDKIDRIYMETTGKKDEVHIDKKMTWKIGEYCYTITRRQPATGDPQTIMEKLIWDPQHYGDK